MPLSILHFSDLHLDTSFAASRLPPEIGRRCREQLRHTLQELLRLARERHADAVTIAGDLFDNDRVQPDTLKFIAEHFAQLAPTPIFIAPGLHDHAGPHSPYRQLLWPANVHIFLTDTLSDRVLSAEYELWGAARVNAEDRQNLLEGFLVSSSGKFPILLLHEKPAGHELSAPEQVPQERESTLTVDGIAHAGFGIALLGRSHQRSITSAAGQAGEKCTIVCPGSPQPLGFDALAEHSAAWVVLAPGCETLIEWLPINSMDFKSLDVAVDDGHHVEAVVAAVTAALQNQRWRGSMTRVRLVGNLSLDFDADLNAVAARVPTGRDSAYLRIENHTQPAIDFTPLTHEPTVRGAFVRDILAVRPDASADQKLYQDALTYGVQAFEQEKIVLR